VGGATGGKKLRSAESAAAEEAVDRFVEKRVRPELREVVAELRRLMRKHAPQAALGMSYGVPVWRVRRIVAVLSPTKKDITFAFSRGADFEDKFGRLHGVGKVSKNLKLASRTDISEAAFRYYVRQALALEKG